METINAKTILSSYKESGWFGTNYTINIYRGCSHGCIYCDSRSDCYHIPYFGEVKAKRDALQILDRELASKTRKGVILTGSMSDPYNPEERRSLLTRGSLELIAKYGFGCVVITKSGMIIRDIMLLKRIQFKAPMAINFTITVADDELAKKIEPNAPSTSARFAALEELSNHGLMCGVILSPLLPFINDTPQNIIEIVERAHDAGAKWIYAYPGFGVTLRSGNREYYYKNLDKLFPGVKNKYIKTYKDSYVCSSLNSDLWEIFASECEKYEIIYDYNAINEYIAENYRTEQMSLFA